jgi:hypothetical protein
MLGVVEVFFAAGFLAVLFLAAGFFAAGFLAPPPPRPARALGEPLPDVREAMG